MGEIKSTLDLIMERTRNMSLSEEEKEELRIRDLKGRLRGLVQKGVEGILSVPQLRSGIESEREKSPETDRLLVAELVGRIDPDGENERVLRIMEEVSGRDSAPFRKVVLECRGDMERQKGRAVEDLRRRLGERGVTGPAVVPNPSVAPAWQQTCEEIRKACRKALDSMLHA